jgi:bile acid:Na+ symporter, BASS family
MELTQVSLVYNLSIAVTVFAYGLYANGLQDVRFLLRQPRLLILSLLAMFVITPVLALAINETLDIPLIAKIALVALALSPIPPLLPQKQLQAGGHASYGIGLVIIVAVLAPVLVPVLAAFLGRLLDQPYGVPSVQIAGVVLGLVVVPLVAGMLFQLRWPGAAEAIAGPATRTAGAVLGLATLAYLIITFPLVWDLIGAWTLLAMVLFNLGALAIGHLVGGPELDRSIVLALSCATRHPGIAITIATANYPGRSFIAAVMLCLIINGIVCGPYLQWQRRRIAAAANVSSP